MRNAFLGGLAVFLAAAAALVGEPSPSAGILLSGLANDIETERDHVEAITLAEWIRDGRPHLRVIDVRPAAAFDAYHIPTAERRSLEDLTSMPAREGETIVLYSGGGAHAAQAWVLLRARGHRDVYFLSGGLDEWIDDVLNPAARGTARAEELSRYFGGVPRADGSPPMVPADRRIVPSRRRGC